MKRALLLAAGLAFAPAAPALAHHNHHLMTSCDSFRMVKRYVPARFNRHGALVGGYWKTKRKCAHPTRTLLVSTPHHHHIHSAYIHNHHLVTSCDSYRVVKRYVPARFNRHGALVGGYWRNKRKCIHPTQMVW